MSHESSLDSYLLRSHQYRMSLQGKWCTRHRYLQTIRLCNCNHSGHHFQNSKANIGDSCPFSHQYRTYCLGIWCTLFQQSLSHTQRGKCNLYSEYFQLRMLSRRDIKYIHVNHLHPCKIQFHMHCSLFHRTWLYIPHDRYSFQYFHFQRLKSYPSGILSIYLHL